MGIAQQVTRSLQRVHSIGYVHWDIKPHNILYSYSESDEFDETPGEVPNKFCLIDFGICSPYLDDEGNHLPMERIQKFRGSLEFWAGDVLAQYRPTRKHDLESLLYTILHLLKNKNTLWKSFLDYGYESNSFDRGMSLKERLKKLS